MLSREDIVIQSVLAFGRSTMAANYSAGDYEFRDSFPYTFEDAHISKAIVAAGFNFDDDGHEAEMGSDLIHRVTTLEYWIFGPTLNQARNIANVLKFAIENQHYIPLKNFAQVGTPVFDQLLVQGVSTMRQIHPNPEPWQEFVYTTTAKCLDEYFASQSYPVT